MYHDPHQQVYHDPNQQMYHDPNYQYQEQYHSPNMSYQQVQPTHNSPTVGNYHLEQPLTSPQPQQQQQTYRLSVDLGHNQQTPSGTFIETHPGKPGH
ncbi:hypothetical protein G6F57_023577 [Rhizopus arrhizus]|nr:hypothetical protein G6F57_023577 [Rhizopus arrhizus]